MAHADAGQHAVARERPGRRVASFAAGLCVAVALAHGSEVHATLYKWTDANGRVVYSDQPPAGNFKVETVGAPPPPSNPKAVQDMAAKDAEFKKRQADLAEKDRKAEAQRVELAKRSEQCQRAQMQIRSLAAEQVAFVRPNEKGVLTVVDEATRRKERAEIESWVKANCTT